MNRSLTLAIPVIVHLVAVVTVADIIVSDIHTPCVHPTWIRVATAVHHSTPWIGGMSGDVKKRRGSLHAMHISPLTTRRCAGVSAAPRFVCSAERSIILRMDLQGEGGKKNGKRHQFHLYVCSLGLALLIQQQRNCLFLLAFRTPGRRWSR